MKIAVLAAMDSEVKLLKTLESADLFIAQTGIGKVHAALKTAEVIRIHKPDLILNSGIAGGLDAQLNIGDVVVGENVCYHDVWCGTPNLKGQIQGLPLFFQSDSKALSVLDTSVHKGLIISGDQFIQDKEKLMSLKADFPEALAVDMESAAVAQTCHIYNTPFITIRLISDTPGVAHHQEQYDAFWQTAAEKSFETLKKILSSLTAKDAN